MRAELLRRGEQNIADAAFVRDHLIPTATKSQRWNIVVYEAFLTIELIVKGMICLSGNKPDKNHDVDHLVDQFHKLLPDEINSQPFLYSATSPSGHAYGIYSDGRSIELLSQVHGVYSCMGSGIPVEESIVQLLMLRLDVKGSTVFVYRGDDPIPIFKQTDSTIPDAIHFSRSFKRPNPAQLRTLRKAAEWLRKRRGPALYGEKTFSPDDAKEAVSRMNSALSAAKAFVIRTT